VRWLIAGGGRFIVANLIRRLEAEDRHAIRVLDNLTTGTQDGWVLACEYAETDIFASSNSATLFLWLFYVRYQVIFTTT
jgi:hypothetical protein